MAKKNPNHTLAVLQRIRSDAVEFQRRTEEQLAQVRREMGEGFVHLDARISKLDSDTTAGFQQVDARISKLDARISGLDARISGLDSDTTMGFQRVVKELQSHRAFAVDKLRDHEQRITALETKGSGE